LEDGRTIHLSHFELTGSGPKYRANGRRRAKENNNNKSPPLLRLPSNKSSSGFCVFSAFSMSSTSKSSSEVGSQGQGAHGGGRGNGLVASSDGLSYFEETKEEQQQQQQQQVAQMTNSNRNSAVGGKNSADGGGGGDGDREDDDDDEDEQGAWDFYPGGERPPDPPTLHAGDLVYVRDGGRADEPWKPGEFLFEFIIIIFFFLRIGSSGGTSLAVFDDKRETVAAG
jgi:hypothetical protein